MFNPGQLFAGYQIVRVLGAGGMGEVYLARHPRLPREDALKVLPKELTGDPTYRARFIREADLAAGLDHPSIVSVYDRGEDQGQLWITMKFIPGSDANQLMKQSGPFSPEDTVEVVAAVADALDYAHGKGLLHRDVKPANILVDGTQATHRKVYLTDFGIARTIGNDTALTAANLTVGSIQYTSPEQLRGGDLNGRADQYSLACTAFRLLTGRAPYQGSKPTEIINAHLNNPIPHARTLRPELPQTVDAVLARAMDKNPVNRYPTCNDFARDLRAALTSATPKPGGYQPTMINPGAASGSTPAQPFAGSTTPLDQQAAQPGAPRFAQQQPGQPQPVQQQPVQQQPGQGHYAQNPYSQNQNSQNQYGQNQYGQNPYPQHQFAQNQYGAGGVPPQYPGPGAPPAAGGGSGGNNKRIAIIAVAVVAVIAALVGAVVWLTSGDDDPSTTAASSSTSVSSGPVSSSVPSSSAPTDPEVVNGVPTQCVAGATSSNSTPTHLVSGRIEIPRSDMPTGWTSDVGSMWYPFVTDVDGVYKNVAGSWAAQIGVGTLPTSFRTDTEAIARKMLECFAAGPGYSSVTASAPSGTSVEPNKLENSGTKVSVLTSTVRVSGGPSGISGDEFMIIVVDSTPMTVAIGVNPVGDTAMRTEVRKAVTALLVSR